MQYMLMMEKIGAITPLRALVCALCPMNHLIPSSVTQELASSYLHLL